MPGRSFSLLGLETVRVYITARFRKTCIHTAFAHSTEHLAAAPQVVHPSRVFLDSKSPCPPQIGDIYRYPGWPEKRRVHPLSGRVAVAVVAGKGHRGKKNPSLSAVFPFAGYLGFNPLGPALGHYLDTCMRRNTRDVGQGAPFFDWATGRKNDDSTVFYVYLA